MKQAAIEEINFHLCNNAQINEFLKSMLLVQSGNKKHGRQKMRPTN